jgi:hypothetical protein
LAGVLTILSPCILPVLPFVFTRADRKFSTNGLPMLIGMAITFAGVATLAAVGGAWVVRFNQFGRALALVLLAAFAATLLSRRLAEALARPFVALGNRLIQSEGAARLRARRHRHVALAGRRHRPVVGALRGAHSRLAADGRGPLRSHAAHDAAAVRLRGGRGHLARRGDVRRRPPGRRVEALARRR